MHRNLDLRLLVSGCGALVVALALLAAHVDDRVTGLAFGGAIGLLALGVWMAKHGKARSSR